jgi:hypothetical protein
MLAVSAVADVGVTWPPVASWVNASMTLPDGTLTAGAILRLNLVCVWSLVSTTSGRRTGATASVPGAEVLHAPDHSRHVVSRQAR